MKKLPLRVVELALGVVYRSPLGHRCRLKPRKTDGNHFTFEYIDKRGEFLLSPDNVWILCRSW